MTTLVKYPSKGMTLLQSVSSVYVAMAGLQSIAVAGEKSETEDTTTLDGPQFKTKDPTGYSDPCTIKASGFFDPAHATYTNFHPLTLTPVPTNFKVTYPDVAPTSNIYNGTGFGWESKGDAGKHVMADIEIVTSGNPS